jgi:hypothetical protein
MAPVYCQAALCHHQRIALDESPAKTIDAEAKGLATKPLTQLAARKAATKSRKGAPPRRPIRQSDARPGAGLALAPRKKFGPLEPKFMHRN